LGLGPESGYTIADAMDLIYYKAGLGAQVISLATAADLPEPTRTRTRMAGYAELRSELEQMTPSTEVDELGRIGPSDYGIKSAIDVSFRMVLSGARLPTPADVSIDRDGAIRILWEVDDRTLELVCPYAPGQGPYIFYAEGEQHRIAYDLSVGQLNRLLSWLNGAQITFRNEQRRQSGCRRQKGTPQG
jgi:hypothetical protein